MYSIDVKGINEFFDSGIAEASITIVNNQTWTITNSDIVMGGLSFNRYASNSDQIDIGTAIAGQCDLTLANYQGQWEARSFLGGKMTVTISKGGYSIPMGVYTIDTAKKLGKTIVLSALDNMIKFDQKADIFTGTSATIITLVQRCCTACGVQLGASIDSFPNSHIVAYKPTVEYTYREVIQWAAAIMGKVAYIGRDGKLYFGWYTPIGDDSEFTAVVGRAIVGKAIVGYREGKVIRPDIRYASEFAEADVGITGITVANENVSATVGTDGYVLTVNNALTNTWIQAQCSSIAQAIYNSIGSTRYRPFTATVLPMPWLDPLDIINAYDDFGNQMQCAVTDWTYTLNGRTAIEGRGMSVIEKGYAPLSPLTPAQSAEISKATSELSKAIDSVADDVSGVQTDVSGLQGDMTTVKGNVSGLQTDVGNLQTDVGDVQTDVSGLQGDVGNLQTDMSGVQGDVGDLQTDMSGVKGNITTLQNNVTTLQSGKNTVYRQASQPTGTFVSGDVWFDSDDGNKMYIWDGNTWSASVWGTNAVGDEAITSAKIKDLVAEKIIAGLLQGFEIDNGSGTFHVDANGSVTANAITITGGTLDIQSAVNDSIIRLWALLSNSSKIETIFSPYAFQRNGYRADGTKETTTQLSTVFESANYDTDGTTVLKQAIYGSDEVVLQNLPTLEALRVTYNDIEIKRGSNYESLIKPSYIDIGMMQCAGIAYSANIVEFTIPLPLILVPSSVVLTAGTTVYVYINGTRKDVSVTSVSAYGINSGSVRFRINSSGLTAATPVTVGLGGRLTFTW